MGVAQQWMSELSSSGHHQILKLEFTKAIFRCLRPQLAEFQTKIKKKKLNIFFQLQKSMPFLEKVASSVLAQ